MWRRCYPRVPGVTRVKADVAEGGLAAIESRERAGTRRAPRAGARPSSAQGWGLLELRPMRMSLEDIFLSLTTEERA